MTTQPLNLTDPDLPEWFDPFPEPNTIPAGWDLDGFMPSRDPQTVEPANDPSEPASPDRKAP